MNHRLAQQLVLLFCQPLRLAFLSEQMAQEAVNWNFDPHFSFSFLPFSLSFPLDDLPEVDFVSIGTGVKVGQDS